MTIAALLVAAAIGLASPADLVARLGSTRYADRERATADLERLGREALPALRRAGEARDPEIRQRAALLVGRIERQRLTRSTPVALALRDAPIGVALETLETRTGFTVRVDPAADPSWKGRRVTLTTAEPIPFWQAMDRLCQAGGLRQGASPPLADRNDPAIRLVPGDPETFPTSYSGPFRVRLTGLHRQKGPIPAASATLVARIELCAEPGLSVAPANSLRLRTAVDDRGQAMFPARVREATTTFPGARRDPEDDGSTIFWNVPLRLPEAPGQRMERLRGEVTVSIVARQSDPTVLPLADLEGKTFPVGDDSVRVERIVQDEGLQGGRNSPVIILLQIVRTSVPVDAPFPMIRNQRKPMATLSVAARRTLKQIEFVDARGHSCEQGVPPTSVRNWPGGERFVVQVHPTPGAGGGPPSALRVHDLIQANADVTFDFAKVPIP